MVEGCDGVVHLAATLHDVALMDHVNVTATAALVRAAERAGVRYFSHASSVVVYGSPRRRFVDETTELLDPYASMCRQYNAEPYMLEYARTKILGELAIRNCASRLRVDILRPTVVVDRHRILESGRWSMLRKLGAAYRRTQYIFAADAAAAVAHLVTRGLNSPPRAGGIEAFNICDDDCGTYRDILRAAYAATGNKRYKLIFDVPIAMDLAKDVVKYRTFAMRYPLGMLDISNARLKATGFAFPTGIRKAVNDVIADKCLASTDDC